MSESTCPYCLVDGKELESKLAKAKAALEFVVNREGLTFAECTDAEQIIATCRQALKEIE